MKDWTGNNKSTFTCLGASNHSKHERADFDYYATDPIAAELLLSVEPDLNNICVMCHGGMTYAGKEKDNKFWIGWDYAHYGDYTGVCEMPILKEFKYLHKNDKKWTTKELIKETKEVIEQL